MAIIRPGGMALNADAIARLGVTTADSATLNDTNFPPANGLDCSGHKRLMVWATFTAGTAPTVIIEPLVRFGSLWVHGTKTIALGDSIGAIIEGFGRLQFLRIDTITGAPTNVSIHVGLIEPFRPDCQRCG